MHPCDGQSGSSAAQPGFQGGALPVDGQGVAQMSSRLNSGLGRFLISHMIGRQMPGT